MLADDVRVGTVMRLIIEHWPYAAALVAAVVAWCASRACITGSSFSDSKSEFSPQELQRFPGGCDFCGRTEEVILLRNNGRICPLCKEAMEAIKAEFNWMGK
jgi:hypothetical protein